MNFMRFSHPSLYICRYAARVAGSVPFPMFRSAQEAPAQLCEELTYDGTRCTIVPKNGYENVRFFGRKTTESEGSRLKDLKHLIFFEDLLQTANNDLIVRAKNDGGRRLRRLYL